uniref:Uncharacterized protein n=1 Tax=Streptomyces sp. FR1 TaxID=349971 RepID=V9Z2B7_9ACTN|nr:hypothetical protein pFRL2_32c [Streptomyces sp. FR1]
MHPTTLASSPAVPDRTLDLSASQQAMEHILAAAVPEMVGALAAALVIAAATWVWRRLRRQPSAQSQPTEKPDA